MITTIYPMVVYGLKVKMSTMVNIDHSKLRCGHTLTSEQKYEYCPHCGKKVEPYKNWVAGYINEIDENGGISLYCGTQADVYNIDKGEELYGVLGVILNKPEINYINPKPVADIDDTTVWHVADYLANNGIPYDPKDIGVYVIQYYN